MSTLFLLSRTLDQTTIGSRQICQYKREKADLGLPNIVKRNDRKCDWSVSMSEYRGHWCFLYIFSTAVYSMPMADIAHFSDSTDEWNILKSFYKTGVTNTKYSLHNFVCSDIFLYSFIIKKD